MTRNLGRDWAVIDWEDGWLYQIGRPVVWMPIFGDPGSGGIRDDAGFGV